MVADAFATSKSEIPNVVPDRATADVQKEHPPYTN
jgi:hypothetical protein